MTALRPSVSVLFAAVAVAFAGGCSRDDASLQMPTAAEATAPVAGAAALANAADAVDPFSASDEMSRAMGAFLEVRSFHAAMTTSTPKGEMTMDMDFAAPDRFRMKTPMGTQYVIGDTMYMTMKGRTMKMALPKGQVTRYRDPAQLEANKATMTVESLGSDSVDGEAARKFRVRNTQPRNHESTIWISRDGYPVKMEIDGQGNENVHMVVRYSRFNDPSIRIDPPQ